MAPSTYRLRQNSSETG